MLSSFLIKLCLVFTFFLSAEASEVLSTDTPTGRDHLIVEKLQEKGSIEQGNVKITKAFTPESRFAERILYITDQNKCKTVAKVYKSIDQCEVDSALLKQSNEFVKLVNELRLKAEYKLPIIMEYIGNETLSLNSEKKGVVVLSRARGEDLKSILAKSEEYGLDKIGNVFLEVGQQLGALDLIFYINKGQHLLMHPDSHAANLIYDEKNNQLYWIDTILKLDKVSTALYLKKSDPTLSRFTFCRLLGIGIHECVVNLRRLSREGGSVDLLAQNVFTLRKNLLVMKSLYEGYKEIFDKGLPSKVPSIKRDYHGCGYINFVTKQMSLINQYISVVVKRMQEPMSLSSKLSPFQREEYSLS